MAEYSMHQSPYDYKLSSFVITSHYHDVPIDITNNISMFEITESLIAPYLTGSFIMLDDLRFLDGTNINGTERITITLDNPTVDSSPIVLNFVISHLKGTHKVQDQREMLDFSIIEENGFNNEISRLSKSYQGTRTEIIEKILRDGLDLQLERPEFECVQPSMKVIIPYMTPFQAANWILSRMTSESGMPYFLFKTIKSDKIQLKSLEEMMRKDPWNTKTPYVYSIANAQAQQQNSGTVDSINLFNVEHFQNEGNTGILHKMLDGVVGSQHAVTDMGSGQTETFQYNANDTFNELISLGIIPKNERPTFHTELEFKNRNLANHNSLNVHRIVMNGTYNNHNNYYEGFDKGNFKLDANRMAISAYLGEASVGLTIPGAPMLIDETNRSIGTRIRFLYLANKTEVQPGENEGTMADLIRSGTYVIANSTHQFADDKHTVSLSGLKLGNERI